MSGEVLRQLDDDYLRRLDDYPRDKVFDALYGLSLERQIYLESVNSQDTRWAVEQVTNGRPVKEIMKSISARDNIRRGFISGDYHNEMHVIAAYQTMDEEYGISQPDDTENLDAQTFYLRSDSQYNLDRTHQLHTVERFREYEQELINSLPELIDGFYSGKADRRLPNGEIQEGDALEVFDLGQLPVAMIKAKDGNLDTNLKLIQWIKEHNWIVFYTDGTIVTMPPTKQGLFELYESFNNDYYMGVGLPKGMAQGAAEKNSTKIIVSYGLKGVDNRKYSDSGLPTGIDARRAMTRDIENNELTGSSQGLQIWAMNNNKAIEPETGWTLEKSKKSQFWQLNDANDPILDEAYNSITMEQYQHVFENVDYPLNINALQPRNISGTKELIMDTIDSTAHSEENNLAITTDRLKYSMALHRAMQVVTERMWNYLYGNKIAKMNLPTAEINVPIGYQLYGESLKMQFRFPEGVQVLKRSQDGDLNRDSSDPRINAERFFTRFLMKVGTITDKALFERFGTGFQASFLTHKDYHINGELKAYYFVQRLLEDYKKLPDQSNEVVTSLTEKVHELKNNLIRIPGLAWMFTGYIQEAPQINSMLEKRAAEFCKTMRRFLLNSDGGSFWMITDDAVFNMNGAYNLSEFVNNFQ